MKASPESNSQTAFPTRRRLIVISVLGLSILLIIIAILKTPITSREPPTLVIRVDDIQDFAFREAQLFLLNESIVNQVPVSLAVIAGMFGEDTEIAQAVKLAVSSGSEVAVHGWNHEDLAELSFGQQAMLLSRSRCQIKEMLDYDVEVLVPPKFSFDENTLRAMNEEGYSIISTLADYAEPGLMSNVISLPATIELSDFSNGIWSMKSLDSIKTEISRSIRRYGYVVIVTHPQEFVTDGILDPDRMELYRTLLVTLKKDYSFETLESLSQNGRRL